MDIIELSPAKLRISDSRYYFIQSATLAPGIEPLASSLNRLGIKTPLLVHSWEKVYHLVDGFKRAIHALKNNWKTLPCQRLPEETPLADLLELLLWEQREGVLVSATGKVRFIHFALRLGLPPDILLESFFPRLQLQGHPRVLRQCLAIAQLPDSVLDFCAEKRFSLKQCFHLTRHPPDLLKQVFAWRDKLALTASTIEELLEHLKGYLRIHNLRLEDLLCDEPINTLLASDLSPQERTQRLRALVRQRRFPLLTAANARLEQMRDRLDLPHNVSLAWDPTLERHELQLKVLLQDPTQWQDTIRHLASPDLPAALSRMLEEL